jgi:signal peptidase I
LRPLIPKPSTGRGALIELVVIVALAVGLALLIQAFIVKPYQIPSQSMEPTLDVGQRVLVDRVSYHFGNPDVGDIVVFHPPEGAVGDGRECGAPGVTDAREIRRSPAPALRLAERFNLTESTVNEIRAGQSIAELDDQGIIQLRGEPCPRPVDQEADTNFIKRIVAGPGDRLSIKDGHPVVNGVMANEDFINPCRGGAGTDCNLRKPITIPPNDYFMMGDNRGSSDDSRFWGPVPRDWIIGKAVFTYWPPDRIGFL